LDRNEESALQQFKRSLVRSAHDEIPFAAQALKFFPRSRVQVEKPATFNVKLNGAIGTLKALVKTPSGTEEDVFSQELDQDEYAMRFLPKENGVYYVYIKFNEAHIPGSPFPMLVGKLGADPALVFAKGEGLEKGEVGGWKFSMRAVVRLRRNL
jgi:hypothetical protein